MRPPQPPQRRDNPRDRVPTLLRRVSTLFTKKQRQQPRSRTLSAPISHLAITSPSRYSSRSPSPPSPDIRLPDGLGPRVDSDYDEDDDEYDAPSVSWVPVDRTRCLSSPGLLTSFPISLNNKLQPTPALTKTIPPDMSVFTPDIPPEVMHLIASFLASSRSDLARLARVDKRTALPAARVALYRSLDLRDILEARTEMLFTVLASTRNRVLGGLVEKFVCVTWPAYLYPHLRSSGGPCSFTKALTNMPNLTSLTLPAFLPSILHTNNPAPFRLTQLTLLDRSMSLKIQTALVAWLAHQPDITELALPCLTEEVGGVTDDGYETENERPRSYIPAEYTPAHNNNNNTNTHTNTHKHPFPKFVPSPAAPVHPKYFLPSLTTLHAPPPLIHLLLAPPRPVPLTSATLIIHSSLIPSPSASFGTPLHPSTSLHPSPAITSTNSRAAPQQHLRPLALMRALRGVMELSIRFGVGVDRRTVEKVVGAVAGVLGVGDDDDDDFGEMTDGERGMMDDESERVGGREGELESLEIIVAWDGSDADEALYKTIQSALPRFRALRTLRLISSATRPPRSPACSSHPTSQPRISSKAQTQEPQPQPQAYSETQTQKQKEKQKEKEPLNITVHPPPSSSPFPLRSPQKPSRSKSTAAIITTKPLPSPPLPPLPPPDDVAVPVQAREVGGASRNGDGEVGFRFEIGHRRGSESGSGIGSSVGNGYDTSRHRHKSQNYASSSLAVARSIGFGIGIGVGVGSANSVEAGVSKSKTSRKTKGKEKEKTRRDDGNVKSRSGDHGRKDEGREGEVRRRASSYSHLLGRPRRVSEHTHDRAIGLGLGLGVGAGYSRSYKEGYQDGARGRVVSADHTSNRGSRHHRINYHNLTPDYQSTTYNQNPNQSQSHIPDPENDRAQLTSWLEQCPSLQTVVFLSGAEWCFLAEGRNSIRSLGDDWEGDGEGVWVGTGYR